MAPKRGNRNPRRRAPPYTRGGPSSAAFNPPSIVTTLKGSSRLRFAGRVIGGVPTIVTRACLLSMLVTNSTTTQAPASLFLVPILQAVRIKRVTIWQEQQSPTTGVADSLSFEYLSDLGKPLKVTRSVISTISSPLSVSPPKMSRASMYSSTQPTTASKNEVLFSIQVDGLVTVNSVDFILDLEFEYLVGNDYGSRITATTTFNASDFAVAGLGCMPLDSFDASGNLGPLNLTPVGITNVFIDNASRAVVVTALARTN